MPARIHGFTCIPRTFSAIMRGSHLSPVQTAEAGGFMAARWKRHPAGCAHTRRICAGAHRRLCEHSSGRPARTYRPDSSRQAGVCHLPLRSAQLPGLPDSYAKQPDLLQFLRRIQLLSGGHSRALRRGKRLSLRNAPLRLTARADALPQPDPQDRMHTHPLHPQ